MLAGVNWLIMTGVSTSFNPTIIYILRVRSLYKLNTANNKVKQG